MQNSPHGQQNYIRLKKMGHLFFFAYKIKTLWPSKLYEHLEYIFLQFDTKFVSKQLTLPKIGTILWLLMSV